MTLPFVLIEVAVVVALAGGSLLVSHLFFWILERWVAADHPPERAVELAPPAQ